MEGTSSQRNDTEFLLNDISVLKSVNPKYISLHIVLLFTSQSIFFPVQLFYFIAIILKSETVF